VEAVLEREGEALDDQYVYLTAKTLWVSGDNANRPGWHSDGFGADDRNYVWYDRAPTEFMADSFTLPDDCADSMAIMEQRAAHAEILTYPVKHLLRLTPSVIHRAPVGVAPGLRTFVKVSISPHRYNLAGNSVNHALGERWALLPRLPERNHPMRDYAA
jgi:hypothetical protein